MLSLRIPRSLRCSLLQREKKAQCLVLFILAIIITSIILFIIHSSPEGVLMTCVCPEETPTDPRLAKYLEPLLQERDSKNRSALDVISEQHPSLAITFLKEEEQRGSRCQLTPGLFDIWHHNSVWQRVDIGATTFLAFGAYFDDRNKEEGPLVRVLVMANAASPPTPTCHLWADGDTIPTATTAISMEFVHWQYPQKGKWLPYIVTCRAEGGDRIPRVAALVSYPCQPATMALRVHRDEVSPRKNLALCHKFIYNPAMDYSRRLVEWFEAARAWGVDDVTFYVLESHPNVKRVLGHYADEGFLHVVPWANPGTQPNVPSLLRLFFDTQRYDLFTDENIPYVDCLLRRLRTHSFVAVWDLDEFILPGREFDSLPEMIKRVKARALEKGDDHPPTSYLARCSYFFDHEALPPSPEVPEYFHMLRHTKRSVKVVEPLVHTKSIHDVSQALSLHAHFALSNIRGPTDHHQDLQHFDPESEGFLGHYRSACQGEDQTLCQREYLPHLVEDLTMWRKEGEIVDNTKRVLRELGLEP
ncbi:uncharacterized protein LOC143021477 [Oratosquilla oratoria]|uniref:uncharacterized protein LOC143021477 n=1 Tax=Oratosquilla oratoria TaxID=337810 RepID=UPI003F75F8E2